MRGASSSGTSLTGNNDVGDNDRERRRLGDWLRRGEQLLRECERLGERLRILWVRRGERLRREYLSRLVVESRR